MRGATRSLRWRLLATAAVAVVVALTAAGLVIARLFERHVTAQFDARLHDHLIQVLAALQRDDAGQPQLQRPLADPRWERPYSGLYWQVQAVQGGAEPLLRSWSLWDAQLALPPDALADGTLHRHRVDGPAGQRLRVLERAVQVGEDAPRWRVAVAADERELQAAQTEFQTTLAAALLALGVALLGAVAMQVGVGLRPLRALQQAVQRVRDGHDTRLQGDFVAEVQPLVDDFNRVLAHAEQVAERARRLAGNLAHAIKTPLAVMGALADDAALPRQRLAAELREQVQAVQRHVDWHLRRARLAGGPLPGLRTEVAPLLQGLVRVMRKVHAHAPRRPDEGAELAWDVEVTPPGLAFAGEAHDAQEIAGNLLDNAGKWARTRVEVRAWQEGPWWVLRVQDDGPGLTPEQCAAVLQRGVRADERAPGAGLGLDIVREVVSLYGGQLQLQRSPWGGLAVYVRLPAAA
ncbi:MAG: sensor histidine kinase [Tepidimonas ignava]|nr:sensor histidine kinase [Tepidimonas ignava]